MAANPYIKRAHAQSEYSPFQLLELERCSEDPIYFMENYVKVQHPTDGVVPFKLYEYQREIIDLIHNNKDSLILCSRQLGKCVFSKTLINICTKPRKWYKILILKLLDKRLYEQITKMPDM